MGTELGLCGPPEHRRFARGLVGTAGAHVVHGHSSHHPMAIEVRSGRPMLYGAGDFINDYEGISGHESFRSDLVLGYFLDLGGPDHALRSLEMVPFRLRRLRLVRSAAEEAAWLRARMDRECRAFGHAVRETGGGALRLAW